MRKIFGLACCLLSAATFFFEIQDKEYLSQVVSRSSRPACLSGNYLPLIVIFVILVPLLLFFGGVFLLSARRWKTGEKLFCLYGAFIFLNLFFKVLFMGMSIPDLLFPHYLSGVHIIFSSVGVIYLVLVKTGSVGKIS